MVRLNGPAVCVAFSVFTCVGCGSTPESTPADGATGDGAVDEVLFPWLADGVPPVAPPDLTPCPEGWREVPPGTDGDPATCDPYPEGGALDCPAGRAHFVGEADCSPVGSACPAPGNDFSETLPSDAPAVYVFAGASGGDGTRASPYGSIGDFSIASLDIGTAIALSRGTHEGAMRLARGVALYGACAEATTLTTAAASSSDGILTARVGASGEAHDLTLANSPRPGVVVLDEGSSVLLAGVVIDGVDRTGVAVVNGGHIDARGLVVRSTRATPGDTRSGQGLLVQLGATADLRQVSLESNHYVGLYVGGVGTMATLSDVGVRDTLPRSDGSAGVGMSVELGAVAVVTRGIFQSNRAFGVFVFESGAMATLDDVVIRDTLRQERDGAFGRGLELELGAAVSATRASIVANEEVGVFASAGTQALTDVVVRDTRVRDLDGLYGRGLVLAGESSSSLTRAHIDSNHDVGVLVAEGAGATLTDVTIRNTRPRESDDTGGRGLSLQGAATANLERAIIDSNVDVGLLASGSGTTATLADAAVLNTQGLPRDGTSGRGVVVQLGATATVSRALVAGNRQSGVASMADGAAITIDHAAIRDTRPLDCAATSCGARDAAANVAVLDGSISLTDFEISDSALCGVHLARAATVDLSNGVVRGQPIGACVQVSDYDVSRLNSGVRYIDNEINLQTTDLPVPEPVEVLGVAP